MPSVDPRLFSAEAIDPSTAEMVQAIAATLAGAPDLWSYPPATVRESRRAGRGVFPLSPPSPRARTEEILGPAGPLMLRIVAPERPRGVYLHIHGGGWVLGGADMQDNALERLAERCGLACVSVEYRLAPEHPYPAGPDDCEAAALWLARHAIERFQTDRLLIGGESAGAHLSVITLIRLRDRHGIMPFAGANLIAGCYDLGLTPSARRWGRRGIVLDTRDIRQFVRHYLPAQVDARDPDVSPLHAELAGLPPALFSVGTSEALLDDSLFMAARWEAAGNRAELRVWPGGIHVFQSFDFPMAHAAFEEERAFLEAHLADQTNEV
jgi:acetyl esterase